MHSAICQGYLRSKLEDSKAHHKCTTKRKLCIKEQSSINSVNANLGVEKELILPLNNLLEKLSQELFNVNIVIKSVGSTKKVCPIIVAKNLTASANQDKCVCAYVCA